MLDLGMLITEECVYPKCEGGYDMCCDTTECGAQNENSRLRFRAAVPPWHGVDVTSHSGDSHRSSLIWRRFFMTQAQRRRPTQLQVKPVRQCARREAVDLDVAQASPLFSDHAPREVHLWQ